MLGRTQHIRPQNRPCAHIVVDNSGPLVCSAKSAALRSTQYQIPPPARRFCRICRTHAARFNHFENDEAMKTNLHDLSCSVAQHSENNVVLVVHPQPPSALAPLCLYITQDGRQTLAINSRHGRRQPNCPRTLRHNPRRTKRRRRGATASALHVHTTREQNQLAHGLQPRRIRPKGFPPEASPTKKGAIAGVGGGSPPRLNLSMERNRTNVPPPKLPLAAPSPRPSPPGPPPARRTPPSPWQTCRCYRRRRRPRGSPRAPPSPPSAPPRSC